MYVPTNLHFSSVGYPSQFEFLQLPFGVIYAFYGQTRYYSIRASPSNNLNSSRLERTVDFGLLVELFLFYAHCSFQHNHITVVSTHLALKLKGQWKLKQPK